MNKDLAKAVDDAYKALGVILLTSHIAIYLTTNDPMARRQATQAWVGLKPFVSDEVLMPMEGDDTDGR